MKRGKVEMGNNGKDKVVGNEGGKAKQGSSRKRGMCGKNWGGGGGVNN